MVDFYGPAIASARNAMFSPPNPGAQGIGSRVVILPHWPSSSSAAGLQPPMCLPGCATHSSFFSKSSVPRSPPSGIMKRKVSKKGPTIMAHGSLKQVVRRIRQIIGLLGDVTDRELLERFAQGKDELAFSALVERHGALVLGVCRRLLNHE